MYAFPDSGRFGTVKAVEIRVRFRPTADVRRIPQSPGPVTNLPAERAVPPHRSPPARQDAVKTSAESSVRMGSVELKSVEVASNNNGTMRSQVIMLATDLVNSATEL